MHVRFDPRALAELGWTPYFHQQFLSFVAGAPAGSELAPARVAADRGREFVVLGFAEPRRAVLSGKLARDVQSDRPCVGDFVVVEARDDPGPLCIRGVLARGSVLRRKAAGATSNAQAIAANVDLVIVLAALAGEGADRHVLGRGLNPRRIERYLRAAAGAPADALVAVTKADLRADAAEQASALARELGVEVVLTSALTGQGVSALEQRLGKGVSAVLVGSSGAGKSSLVNRLLGRDVQRVEAVREEDARGRHTTVHRELFTLAAGGLLIDTPGMRELALFASEETELEGTGFSEVDALAAHCRFRDCRHTDEPGCAVVAAVLRGEVSAARLEHGEKLRRELERQQRRASERERRNERKRGRVLSRAVRTALKEKYGKR
jgi:ribosome biogenesis GTPase